MPKWPGGFGICDAVATVKANGGTSIIGGGDSVSAVKKRKASIKVHLNESLHGDLPKAISLFLFLSYFLSA